MLRKLLLAQWFGPLPPWYKVWSENVGQLGEYGYDIRIDLDEIGFAERVKDTIGVTFPGGGYKVCDYRCAFGLIYADVLKGYDMWGTTDMDMVYGRVGHFMNDTRLSGLDQWSNHPTYVSGPWSMYRNSPEVNELFMREPDWRGYLEEPETSGWVEQGYSRLVANSGLQYLWTNWQTKNLDRFDMVRWQGPKLMDGTMETMMVHFRRTKVYPPQLIR